jgi:hypothetical protein
MSRWQISQGFTFVMTSTSTVFGVAAITVPQWCGCVTQLILTSSKLSTLTRYVPFLSQPTHFITRMDPDIFDGIA